jgi:PAS domain S-box-containing protein
MAQLSWTDYLKIEEFTEQIGEGFGVLDQEGKIQHVNNQFAETFGYSPEEMLGLSFDSLRNQDSIEPVIASPTEERIFTLFKKDGSSFSAKVDSHALDDSIGGWYILVSKLDESGWFMSYDFFRALEHAAQRIAIVGRDLRIQYINIPLSDIDMAEMKGMSVLDGVQPEYRDGLRDAVEAVFEDGIPGSIEISELGNDSQENWFVLRISPIKVGNTVESVVVTGTNITERVLAEKALREEESKYRSIVEQSLVGIAILPANVTNILFANSKLGDMLGYLPSDLPTLGTEPLADLVYTDDREDVFQYLLACIQEENQGKLIQVRLNHRDGFQTWAELAAGRIEYQGEIAVQISLVDITKRYEMEQGLIKSEERERTLLQSLNDLVIVHDENNRYVEAFTGNRDLLYTAPENYLGRHITEVLPEPVALQYLRCVEEVRETGINSHVDYPLEMDGKTLWFSANMSLHEDGRSVVVTVRDVTSRYEIEETLRRERRIFRELAETFIHEMDIPALGERFLHIISQSFGFDIGVFGLFDSKQGVLRKSSSIGEYYESTPTDLYIQDESLDTFLVGQVFKQKKSFYISNIELELSAKPYLSRIYNHGAKSTLAFPILDEKGEVLGIASLAARHVRTFSEDEKELFNTIANMLGTAIEQKTAELALKMSERRYRELLTDVSEGVGICDLKENILFVNRAFANILSYSPEELVGMNLNDLVDPGYLDRIESPPCRRTEDVSSAYDIQFITRNDERKLCRISAVPSRDNNGEIDGTVAIVTDITEQANAEEALRESEVRFRSVFEATAVGMHLYELSDDGHLILIDANPAADVVLRSANDQYIGKPLELAVPKIYSDTDITERYYNVMRTGIPWNTETTMKKDDTIVGSLQIQVFRTSPRTMVASFLDISERVIAEQEIRKLNEELSGRVEERTAELAAANKELEAFAYSVSHDLRAPLRTIDGFSQALLEDYTDIIDETGKDYLRRVRAAASRMSSLIEDILGLSRVTRSEMERRSVNLSEVVREVFEDIKALEPEREIDISIADGAIARCDRRLMKVVLQNLIGNAWKFTRNVEKPKIEFGIKEQDGKTVFYIKDNGAGFDMKYKDKLFVPFQRLHQPDEFEGSGIGLATVQRIMNRHGGLIWADGAVNKGATFNFTIPEKGDTTR